MRVQGFEGAEMMYWKKKSLESTVQTLKNNDKNKYF